MVKPVSLYQNHFSLAALQLAHVTNAVVVDEMMSDDPLELCEHS